MWVQYSSHFHLKKKPSSFFCAPPLPLEFITFLSLLLWFHIDTHTPFWVLLVLLLRTYIYDWPCGWITHQGLILEESRFFLSQHPLIAGNSSSRGGTLRNPSHSGLLTGSGVWEQVLFWSSYCGDFIVQFSVMSRR